MENSASSRICCTCEQETEATSLHRDSSWASSIDDLLFLDHSTASSSFHDQDASLFYSSSASLYRKRRKVAATVSDDELEDTATSPPRPAITSKGKGSDGYCGEDEGRIEVGYVGRDSNCSNKGLKNIGLCLVPLSMAANYFG